MLFRVQPLQGSVMAYTDPSLYSAIITLDGKEVTTGIKPYAEYDICPSGSNPYDCLESGTYDISSYATATGAPTIESDTQELVVTSAECEGSSTPVSELLGTGSGLPNENGDIDCLCPSTGIYVSEGAACPSSQACPPGSLFTLLGGTGSASGNCQCPGTSQIFSSGISSCPSPATPKTCSGGESLMPNGNCGCTNGIPNAQGACVACPSGTRRHLMRQRTNTTVQARIRHHARMPHHTSNASAPTAATYKARAIAFHQHLPQTHWLPDAITALAGNAQRSQIADRLRRYWNV